MPKLAFLSGVKSCEVVQGLPVTTQWKAIFVVNGMIPSLSTIVVNLHKSVTVTHTYPTLILHPQKEQPFSQPSKRLDITKRG